MAQHCVHARLCCLFCDKPQPPDDNHGGLEIATHDKPTFWICEHCRRSETERTRALEAALLVNGETKRFDKTVSSSCARRLSMQSDPGEVDPNSNCACQACVERKHLEQEQIREVQDLQKCWVQLRHAVRQMYRDRLLRDGVTGKGKKFDVVKLKDLVFKLASRDPHQLYQRLESQAREHVMELKVQLLQILVSPEKSGVNSKRSEKDKSVTSQITPEVAKHFLRSLLGFAGQFFDTVDNMRCCLEKLEKEHLEKFGITWRIVNCNLFDTIVYQDSLVQASLPEIYKQLGFASLDSESDSPGSLLDQKPLPLDVAEMMKNFIELDSTMAACREQMDKAQERMEDYLAQQMKIYKATLKAKQKMLKEDLEFFKQQRKLLEEYVAKKKELKKTTNSEEELSAFTEALRSLLSNNRQSREHSASTAECARCQQRHCPCDECTISHLITCGLMNENDELPDSIQFLEEINDSSNESISDSDDSEYGSVDGCLTDEKFPGVDIICRKRTSIICSDGQKVTKVETTILPSSLYTLHNRSHSQSSVQQHMYNAYGDWEVSSDPSSWLFAGRWDQLASMKCVKRNCHKRPEPEGQTDQPSPPVDCKTDSAKNDGDADESPTVGLAKTMENHNSPSKGSSKGMGKKELPSIVGGDKKQCLLNSNSVTNKNQPKQNSKQKCTNPDSPMSKVPPELLKIMKDEKLAKALALAAAKRGSSKSNEPYWKDLNLDVETIRRICSQHNDVSTKNSTGDQKASKQSQSVGTQVEQLADDDDDSWSDRSSVSQKDGKHCDCCYCEMFGQGNNRIGRDDFPQIRERLRLKLKKKTGEPIEHECQVAAAAVATEIKAEQVSGYRGNQNLDDLIEYIEGSPVNAQHKASSKSAKRQRQKQKKAAETKRYPDASTKPRPMSMHSTFENAHLSKSSVQFHKRQRSLDENLSEDSMKKLDDLSGKSLQKNCTISKSSVVLEQFHSNGALTAKQTSSMTNGELSTAKIKNSKCKESLVMQISPKKKGKKKSAKDESLNIDEVFQPKNIDLNACDLDEADKEVEIFKRFVMDCQPSEKREKVQLNLGNLLRGKKLTPTACADG